MNHDTTMDQCLNCPHLNIEHLAPGRHLNNKTGCVSCPCQKTHRTPGQK